MNVEQLKKAISEAFEKAAEEAAEKILEECPRKELKEEPEVWGPKEGDVYCYIQTNTNNVGVTSWVDDDFDRGVNKVGNIFRTEDEAEKAVEWLKARKVLFDDAKGFKPNWRDPYELKYQVELVHDTPSHPELEAWSMHSVQGTPGPFFATAEDANASIKAHEKEWKIYLLGSDSND